MIVAFDTYFCNGTLYTVGGVFKSWVDNNICYYVTNKEVYAVGTQQETEISSIMKCLSRLDMNKVDCIVINGFVWSTQDGKTVSSGFGSKISDSIILTYGEKKIVVGITREESAKGIPYTKECKRGLEDFATYYISCSETVYAEHYAKLIKRMDGDKGMPTLFDTIEDKLLRFYECDEERVLGGPLNVDMNDINDWAKKTFAKLNQ